VAVSDFVLVQGMSDTRATLREWNARPWPAVRAWALLAAAVAAGLLGGVLVVASVADPDPTPVWIAGISGPAGLDDVGSVIARNLLVLALHAFACVAGFIAGASLPLSAARYEGLTRLVHLKMRPVALAWVVAVTIFSLVTQAYILGSTGATLAGQLGISPGVLVLSALPHALPELVALFLPLAAWTIASRRDDWHQLLAATFATTAIALPVLVVAASWEAYAWPRLLMAISPLV
jgi:hypothetical protein